MYDKSFRRAVKYDAKLRFAVCGPSGSGKTYTLLQLATELGGPVALIDTERGSASNMRISSSSTCWNWNLTTRRG